MKTATVRLEHCICAHPNTGHYSTLYADGIRRPTACRYEGCPCQEYVRDWWLSRIVYRRLITSFALRKELHHGTE